MEKGRETGAKAKKEAPRKRRAGRNSRQEVKTGNRKENEKARREAVEEGKGGERGAERAIAIEGKKAIGRGRKKSGNEWQGDEGDGKRPHRRKSRAAWE